MKNKTIKPRKIVCRAFCFSPKHQIVKIGEMLHSKIVRRAFFSAEMKNQASPEKMSAEKFIFCLKHQLVKRGKILREKLPA